MSTTTNTSSIESIAVKKEIELHHQLHGIDCIGFDMDMTLVRYKNDALCRLIFDNLLTTLIPNHPHLKSCPLNMDLCHRGTIIDIHNGYILKLDSKKRVLRAYFGDEVVSKTQIDNEYHKATIEGTDLPLENFTGNSSSRYLVLSSFFELPLGPIWLCHINHLKQLETLAPGQEYVSLKKNDIQSFIKSIIASMDYSFNDYWNSEYHATIRANPGNFVYKATEEFKSWLRRMRERGVRVLLITNSKSEYAHMLMTYSYGENFQELFDLVITDARKPTYFSPNNTSPTYDLKNFFPKEINESMKHNGLLEFNTNTVYHQGNVNDLIASIRASKNKEDISFCYVGDHLIYDVTSPKQHLKWMTIAIVEEIEDPDEIVILKRSSPPFQSKSGAVTTTGKQYEWGSFFSFHDHAVGATTETFWSYVIRYNADIAVPSVETLAKYFDDSAFDKDSLLPCSIIYT
ncbi:hypothetical protein SAMD00019534_011140 [Acytostelium subglobosum LB1]|uniref:hypothetical protein n=1 Tax=Acytostelium subglobosum LB1 TaxID=1410327 RepID=UPI0006451B22|nr:hypothetical protein SAMD00019534_011140 [Acytostelium subglobosum LB1]GAM17939.1 hypothetical protein SAMD00019534_011140 [Acytostelium subglobosum LB1]|eukprot:XP_012758535.1 hypothetical protein SAMD00019534_011140 [Acytostelium subglobosum LB1]